MNNKHAGLLSSQNLLTHPYNRPFLRKGNHSSSIAVHTHKNAIGNHKV